MYFSSRWMATICFGSETMTQTLLEKRVAALEHEVADLKAVLAERPTKDWRRTVGIFGDDPGMREIFHEAMKIREENRRRTRPRQHAGERPGDDPPRY